MTDRDMKRILKAPPRVKLRSRSKMSEADDKEICRLYYKLDVSMKVLMDRYGISESTFMRKTFGGKGYGRNSKAR